MESMTDTLHKVRKGDKNNAEYSSTSDNTMAVGTRLYDKRWVFTESIFDDFNQMLKKGGAGFGQSINFRRCKPTVNQNRIGYILSPILYYWDADYRFDSYEDYKNANSVGVQIIFDVFKEVHVDKNPWSDAYDELWIAGIWGCEDDYRHWDIPKYKSPIDLVKNNQIRIALYNHCDEPLYDFEYGKHYIFEPNITSPFDTKWHDYIVYDHYS